MSINCKSGLGIVTVCCYIMKASQSPLYKRARFDHVHSLITCTLSTPERCWVVQLQSPGYCVRYLALWKSKCHLRPISPACVRVCVCIVHRFRWRHTVTFRPFITHLLSMHNDAHRQPSCHLFTSKLFQPTDRGCAATFQTYYYLIISSAKLFFSLAGFFHQSAERTVYFWGVHLLRSVESCWMNEVMHSYFYLSPSSVQGLGLMSKNCLRSCGPFLNVIQQTPNILGACLIE